MLYSRSFWNRVKFPLDQRFSETYVVSGIDRSGEKSQSHDGDGDTMNIASFVRKTKELLLNEEVLKEVEEAAPGDQVDFLLPCGGSEMQCRSLQCRIANVEATERRIVQ